MNENRKRIYIANWKSYFTYTQSVAWLNDHSNEMVELTHKQHVIICPDFLTIAAAHIKKLPFTLGAQSCSTHETGAYTGEISAYSLQECGVTYCIVGHSERRKFAHETLEEGVQKIKILLQHAITPIVCLSDAYTQELDTILPLLQSLQNYTIIWAYEPVSAIGTGILPSLSHLETTITTLKNRLLHDAPHISSLVLYGGSVNSGNIKELKKITSIDGFLIGKASTDFQELKKIVEYT